MTQLRILLDANLSPSLATVLRVRFAFDVESLQTLGLGHLTDDAVVDLAKRDDRIIVTLDADFGDIYYRRERGAIGVIYLKVQDQSRSAIVRVLEDFFEHRPPDVDLHRSLVVVTEHRVRTISV